MIWDKYKDAFDIFADTELKISEKTDYDDYTGEYTETVICTLTGDIQPYSDNLAKTEYGLDIECEMKFYCADIPDTVKAGMLAKHGDTKYQIQYARREKLGGMLFLKRTVA